MSAHVEPHAMPVTRTAWPLERILFALAGTVTLLSVAFGVERGCPR